MPLISSETLLRRKKIKSVKIVSCVCKTTEKRGLDLVGPSKNFCIWGGMERVTVGKTPHWIFAFVMPKILALSSLKDGI